MLLQEHTKQETLKRSMAVLFLLLAVQFFLNEVCVNKQHYGFQLEAGTSVSATRPSVRSYAVTLVSHLDKLSAILRLR